VAFHKGAVKEDSYPTWDVLAPAVNARLKATLVDRDALAARVMVHFMPAMKYRGLLAILTFLKPASDAARAEKVIETELDRFVREPLSPEEFTAAVKAWAGPAEMKDEPLAQELADWHAMTGDYRNMFRHRTRVEATTPAQVQSLAAETFRRDGRTVATMSVK
jgi:predicted Zn-dependent peptidase